MTTQWFALTLLVPSPLDDAVCNFLFECGTSGLQTDDENTQVSITAYFEAVPPTDAIRRFLNDLGLPTGEGETGRLHVAQVAEQDWAENWKEHVTPQVIGQRLYVCPPWQESHPPDRIAIVIDPGMAFGTGLHPTTRGCLEVMESAVARRAIHRALDLGTGSGILAIALAKLGVGDVRAIDTDPVACAVAAHNAARNGVTNRIIVSGGLENVSGLFDLIVANLFANALIETAPRLVSLLALDASIICAGYLTSDERALRDAYLRMGLSVVTRWEEETWVTLQFANASHP